MSHNLCDILYVQGSGRDGAPAATVTDENEGDSILASVSDSFSELSESVSDFVSENIPGIVHSALEFEYLEFKLL